MGTVDLNNLPSKPAAWRIGSAADINDLGQIVGDAWFQDDDGQTRSHAFLYTPGVGFIALGSLPDYPWSYAQAINIRGEVVGIAENDGASQERAFLGTAQAGMTLIDVGEIDYSVARDISDSGSVTGTMKVNGEQRAFRYTAVGIQTFWLGQSKMGTSYSRGYAINNNGQVAGTSTAKGANYQRAFRYSDTTGLTNLGTLDNATWTWSEGRDINSAGQVVGPSSKSLGGNYRAQETRIFLYADGDGMLDLWNLIGNPQGGAVTDVYGYGLRINDGVTFSDGSLSRFGQIAGTIGGISFLLTPDR
jgi:probable HAF family extracellular repeat protein